MKIINLTQHLATPEQIAAGVIDLDADARAKLSAAITFFSLPSVSELAARAEIVATIASNHRDADKEFDAAMIAGASYFIPALENALREANIVPLHAFSLREQIQTELADGSVKRETIFRHRGFVQTI